MSHTTLKQLAVALIALGLSAQPVFAQHRRTSAGRDTGRSSAAQGARPSQSRSSGSFRAVERGGGEQSGGRFEGSRRVEAAPRVPPSVQTVPQAPAPATPRGELRSGIAVPRAGVAVPRGSVTPAHPYAPHYEPRYQPRYTEPRYQPRYVPRYAPNYRAYRYAYRAFARPYYSFRPRFQLGFGLWIGYPIAYPVYVEAYPYPYPSFSYPANGVYANVGGLSFDITPADAALYVDDQYVGIVADYSPNRMPLSLTPGRHEIEIRAPGFMTMSFEVDIRPGEVIPYQGAMQPW